MRAPLASRSRVRTHQTGVTLIEVLVTVLVLSIGLIGLASLQGNSLKANHSAYMRAQATILAHEMFDVMRIDRENARAQEYDGDYSAPPAATGQLPQDELNRWITNLQNTLPAPEAEIQTTPATGVVRISVTWDDTRGQEPPQVFTLRTRL
ncbi:hypothetical protein TVD_01440 [Thioalkalivibrio versutus]|uniref:Type IV pilus modification protein PilV n=1 Tax=Thioalkalivibrio versutus TaxID=106634 RepID=A0A0G3FYX3_9GAMM|nr:hypothetical protein TVD_01440 [Thioalkalivibrio versutus]